MTPVGTSGSAIRLILALACRENYPSIILYEFKGSCILV